jgi:3-oxoacyl-[acyl-carrier protein] reductase
MQIDLGGRVAFVSGAARGIGYATVKRLLEAGCSVVANVRAMDDETRIALAALEDIRPGGLIVVEGSISESETVKRAAKVVLERFKRLDVLVNNAGILRDNLIGMISDDEMDLVLRTNVIGMLKTTQSLARIMLRGRGGSIINLASIIGRRGNSGQLVYGASKAAVIGLTLSASKELAPRGVRVNAIAPGFIETRMTSNLPDASRQKLVDQIAMGRPGTAEDVADVALFLASDLSRYVTGQVIGVDGGLVL